MKNNILLIISREYNQRVRKKGFVVTTLLMPIVFLAMMFAPALLQNVGSEISSVTLVDNSGKLSKYIVETPSVPYAFTDQSIDSLKSNPDIGTIVVIPENIDVEPVLVTFYHHDAVSFEMEYSVEADVKRAIEAYRLEASEIPNIQEVVDGLEANLAINSIEIDEQGEETTSDALTGYIVGMATAFILYMFILIYGQLVMMSIIEEKNNRVLEIIVTSVKPTHLMIGKILGIGAVAVTQVVIWALLIAGFIEFALPEIVGSQVMAELDALRAGTLDPSQATSDMGLLQVLALLGSLGYIFTIFGYLVLFLIGGFLLYASIFAAIGASVDNAQDAAQLQSFCVVPVLIGFVFAMSVGQNPDTPLATILSLIPFTSPMVMMARIPTGVPAGEIILSLVLLYATIIFMIWFAAKIYRVGIFMYGKKPTIKELIRWARYS